MRTCLLQYIKIVLTYFGICTYQNTHTYIPHAVEHVALPCHSQQQVGHGHQVQLRLLHILKIGVRLPDFCLQLKLSSTPLET